MEKNQAAKWVVFAYGLPGHANPGQPVTGDAANITANIRIDGGAANAVDDVNPTELEAGYYFFDTTTAESNGDLLLLIPSSSTANVQVIAVPGVVYTRPPNFNALGIAADGDISGNVDGAVASVAGAVGSVTAPVTTDAASRAASQADVSGLSTFDHTSDEVITDAASRAASQADLSNISTGSPALSTRAFNGLVTTGVVLGGSTYEDTYTIGGATHSFTEDGSGNLNVEYIFQLQDGGVGTEVVMHVNFTGNGDILALQVYNETLGDWDPIGMITASSGYEIVESKVSLDVLHTGTGLNEGLVRVRAYEDAGGLSSVQVDIDKASIDFGVLYDSVATDVGEIKAKTDSLTFTTANQVDSNPLSIANSGKAATNLRASALGIDPGLAVTGTLSTSQMTTDLTEVTDNHYIGRVIIWTSGSLANQGSNITAYDGTTKMLTYVATTDAPANGDSFVIV